MQNALSDNVNEASSVFSTVWNVIFRGRGSIWRLWPVTPAAPRNVSDISYVTRISHDSRFSWQAQYLVMLSLIFRGKRHIIC